MAEDIVKLKMAGDIFKLTVLLMLASVLKSSDQQDNSAVTNSPRIEDYKTPKDCNAYYTSDFTGVALECEIYIIDETVSLAAIPSHFTQSLNLICRDSYEESSLANLLFAHLTELRELEIINCKFNNLPRTTFSPLSNTLSYLGVRCNYQTQEKESATSLIMEDSAIGQLKLLRALDLSENNMRSFPRETFCQTTHLQVVNLSNNYFHHLNMFGFGESCNSSNETETCGQSNIRIIDLSFNKLTNLEPDCFCRLTKLQKLGLQGNLISNIASNAFLSLKNLTLLDLSMNQIKSIQISSFSHLTSLQVLNMSQNNIEAEILDGIFFELINLQILDLSRNQIANISARITDGLTKLQYLYLSHNNILTIAESTFDYLPELSFLNIENNILEIVTNITWNRLNNLKTLLLNDNNISTMENNVLQCCTQLTTISLSNNKLTIAPNISMLTQLTTVDFSGNNMSSIDENMFKGMNNIIGISLKANKIIKLPESLFKDLQNLIVLNLSENELETIGTTTLRFLKKMEYLVLNKNRIDAIPNLQLNQNLVYLDVSNNFITLLDYGMVPTNLTQLLASGNRIRTIDTKFFYAKNIPLTYLDLSSNQLRQLSASSIPTTLVYLNVDNNAISDVAIGSFAYSTAIQTVSLKGNQIKTIYKATLRTSVPVGQSRPQFMLSGNPLVCDCNLWWINKENSGSTVETLGVIQDINFLYCWVPIMGKPVEKRLSLVTKVAYDDFWCEFQNFTLPTIVCTPGKTDACVRACPINCHCYNSHDWSRTIAFCGDANITSVPRGIPITAVEIHLDGNQIHSLNETSFESYTLLNVLYLNASQIQAIAKNTFAGMATLQVLHLEKNELETLSSGTFTGLVNLRTLLLFSNKLRDLYEDLFVPLKSLDVLQLQDNQLTTFPVWVLESTASLEQITLGSNPWSCDCKYVDKYREWLQKFANKIMDSEKLECRTPPDVINPDEAATVVPLIAFNASLCMPADVFVDVNLSIIVSVIIAFILLITVSVLVFSYRHELQVLIYTRYGVRLRLIRPFQEPCDDGEKVFDAFIAYSSLDDVFIAHELLPGLENGEHPFKLCLHHRNFLVGGVITNSIIEAIEKSRRTIVIMSDNFAASNWCRFEFKSAHLKMMEDRCQRLIMVVLGDITVELDEEVKLYLKTNTYLQWGDKLFWQKLYYAMPDRPK